MLETPYWGEAKAIVEAFGGLLSLRSQCPESLQSAPLAQNGPGSLPRTLAATLQDIETKRQLALQQKGECPGVCLPLPRTFHRMFFFNGDPNSRKDLDTYREPPWVLLRGRDPRGWGAVSSCLEGPTSKGVGFD